MTWSTRTISTFVAATVPVEKAGDVNPLLEAAQQIGQEPRSDEEIEASRHEQRVNEPKVGSYESFMSTFGNPQRWAGR